MDHEHVFSWIECQRDRWPVSPRSFVEDSFLVQKLSPTWLFAVQTYRAKLRYGIKVCYAGSRARHGTACRTTYRTVPYGVERRRIWLESGDAWRRTTPCGAVPCRITVTLQHELNEVAPAAAVAADFDNDR